MRLRLYDKNMYGKVQLSDLYSEELRSARGMCVRTPCKCSFMNIHSIHLSIKTIFIIFIVKWLELFL